MWLAGIQLQMSAGQAQVQASICVSNREKKNLFLLEYTMPEKLIECEMRKQRFFGKLTWQEAFEVHSVQRKKTASVEVVSTSQTPPNNGQVGFFFFQMTFSPDLHEVEIWLWKEEAATSGWWMGISHPQITR